MTATSTAERAAQTFALQYVYVDDPEAMARIRPAHRAFLADLHAQGTVVLSGPLAGDGPAGALIVLRGSGPEELLRVLDADPFHEAGLIAERTIRPWTVVIGELPARG